MTEAEKEIRAALEAGPTPGEWEADTSRKYTSHARVETGEKLICHVGNGEDPKEAFEEWSTNARYIRACNPVAMAALLSELTSLREERDRLREGKDENWSLAEEERHDANHWHAEYEDAVATIAELKAALKPFAAHETADGFPDGFLRLPDAHPLLFIGLGDECRASITIGDIRRARALIQETKP